MHAAVYDEAGKFVAAEHHKFDHSYPATNLMFIPDKEGTKPDLMATTGDCLRLWSIHDDRVDMELLLTHVGSTGYLFLHIAHQACSQATQLHQIACIWCLDLLDFTE